MSYNIDNFHDGLNFDVRKTEIYQQSQRKILLCELVKYVQILQICKAYFPYFTTFCNKTMQFY